ncbi:MAG: hypothetical protein B6U76_02350 [Desulfurococcales archaeon ex4484_217_2]|nr:MAG: hypothetical protein B6U76_02350 [Desulfurococcales archaeon ex4484_217_2]
MALSPLSLMVDEEYIEGAVIYEGLKIKDYYPAGIFVDEYIGVIGLLATVTLKSLDDFIIMRKAGKWYLIIPLFNNRVLVLIFKGDLKKGDVMEFSESILRSLNMLASLSSKV